LLTDNLSLGAEYRQKPNNLYLSLTAAFAELGNIANQRSENGICGACIHSGGRHVLPRG
jgi:hypothetical protein